LDNIAMLAFSVQQLDILFYRGEILIILNGPGWQKSKDLFYWKRCLLS